MTTTYDPFHPRYFDQVDLREELDRVFDLCHGCRLCFKFCPSFPTLFDYVDAIPGQDASQMTAAQQDHVVDQCFQCKLCYVNCPYTPGRSEWELDFPRLMMRAGQVRHRSGGAKPLRTRLTDVGLSRNDQLGTVGSKLSGVVNRIIATPGSAGRRVIERTAGIAAQRVLPPYARQRFSTWFRRRGDGVGRLGRSKQSNAVLFPTCMIEYQSAAIGHDIVKVYERNGVECSLPEGEVCCGAPMLHQGDVEGFRKLAQKNIDVLAAAIRAGDDETVVAVAQPTCGYVLKFDYIDYVGGPDAELVADRTRDVCEHLIDLHKGDRTELDTDFPGEVPESTTYHAPCHLRAQNVGLRSRDLLELTGSEISVVAECSGIDGTWGLRAENVELSRRVAKKMAAAIDRADGATVAGDCTLANGGITLETGRVPVHPIQQVARAYGIEPEAEEAP